MAETLPYSGASNFDTSNSFLQRASELANPTRMSSDTASARIRARMQGAQQGIESQLGDQFAGRGGQGGLYNRELRISRGNYLSNLGSATADYETGIEKDYQSRLLDAAKIFGDLGSTAAQTGIEQQKNATTRELGLAQTNNESARIQAERDINQYQNIVNLLDTFGKVGNSRGTAEFNDRLAGILQALFPMAGLSTLPLAPGAPTVAPTTYPTTTSSTLQPWQTSGPGGMGA